MGSRAQNAYDRQVILANRGILAKYGLQNITPEEAQKRLDLLDKMEKEAAVRLAIRRAARDQEEYAKILDDF